MARADVEFEAAVVRQPGPDGPGRVRATLRNRRRTRARFSGGDPIPLSGPETEPVEADAPLLLYPDGDDRANEYAWAGEDGELLDGVPPTAEAATFDGDCWRAPGVVVHQLVGQVASVDPDAAVAADFSLLARHDGGCPAGTYVAGGSATVSVDGTVVGGVETTMRVVVGAAGVAVDGSAVVR